MICEATSQTDVYLPVSVSTLTPTKAIGIPLYARDPHDRRFTLYRAADYPIQSEDIEHLIDRGVRQLFVAAENHQQYQQYLRSTLIQTFCDESVPAPRRFAQLNVVVRDSLEHAFRTPDVSETLRTAQEMANLTVGVICGGQLLARDLLRMLYHDYQTFTHSANVAYYCVILARELGAADEVELKEIAAGALLHDLGKTRIPSSILNKPARLTPQEFETVQTHATIGFRALASRSDLSLGQLMMVYQHHERLNGTGYPVGSVADEIHPWARICAVADVYEALTSERPYRPALSTAGAIKIMQRQSGAELDERVFQCWKAIISSN